MIATIANERWRDPILRMASGRDGDSLASADEIQIISFAAALVTEGNH